MDEAERFIHQVSREVKKRLDNIGMLGRSLTLKVLKRSPSAPIEPPKVRLISGNLIISHFSIPIVSRAR